MLLVFSMSIDPPPPPPPPSLGCLSEWCRLLSANPAVAELYRPSSFLASTGFRPALACLERLPPPPPTCSVSLPSDFYHSAEAFQS